jgi:outer membrane immunogenic protein
MKARTWLLSSVATVALAFNASAADMSLPMKAPVVYAAPFSWTGFYLGATAGGIGISSENTYTTDYFPSFYGSGNGETTKGTGVLAGGTVGYNFQTGQWVIGIEVDYSMASAQTGNFAPDWNFAGGAGQTQISSVGTLRARLGWASDHTLLFITGGLAWGDITATAYAPVTAAAGCRHGFSGTQTGWTFGGGVEHALTDHFTVKLEALYVDFGSKSVGSPGRSGCSFGFSAKTTAAIGRLGLNYKF